MHYLITGHTGFKGAWLTLWLTSQGHEVSGISLDPLKGALYETANVSELVSNDFLIDIRDSENLKKAINKISPEVVFHLAAQPLVRESYRNPRETFETNVMGTYNLLEAVSSTQSVKAQIVVTTDKVYRNVNQMEGYGEHDPLGGEDPYSASKAAADIISQSWIKSFASPPTAIVRAGNVIGGGDVSKDRLIPDLIEAFENDTSPILRYPSAIRPWQHVLDCLNGYLIIKNELLSGKDSLIVNIGPGRQELLTVSEVAESVGSLMNSSKKWKLDPDSNPKEAEKLFLSTEFAQSNLGIENKLSAQMSIQWTIDWYLKFREGSEPRSLSLEQISNYESLLT